MAKKSAAQAKIIKKKAEPTIDAKQDFEEQKEFEISILEQQLVCVNRIDFLDDLRSDYKDYLGYLPDPESIKAYANGCGEVFYDILERVRKFKYEDFAKEEFDNPFEDMLISVADVEPNDEDMWWAHMIFRLVRPFGEHVNSLHTRTCELAKEQADA